MMYSGVKTNESLMFLKCPVCGNDQFSHEAEFCRVCGSAIYNFCKDHYDETGYKKSNGCGRPNPGNARFCEYCGNPTLLYEYLSKWEDEKVHSEKYGESDDNLNCVFDEDLNFMVDEPIEDKVEIPSNQGEILDEDDSISSFKEDVAETDDFSHAFDEFLDEDEEDDKE